MFRKRGFTLVEVLLVIVIIGILAAIVLPRIMYSRGQAEKEACKANKAAINSQVELYHVTEPGSPWPAATFTRDANGTIITDDSDPDFWMSDNYFPDGVPGCPVDGTDYSLAANHRVTGHSH